MAQMLLCPNTDVSPDITFSDNASCFDMIWERGHKINPNEYDLSCLEFICESLPAGQMPDFAISDLGCPIVSTRLKEHITRQGVDNIQFFPAQIIEKSGDSPKTGYFAVNIIGLVDCIDFEKSDLEGDEEDGEYVAIDYIDELVLKQPVVSYGAIYRARLFRRVIVVDGLLVQALQNEKINGVRLIEPQKWDGFFGEK